jgi:hypothetical protein
MVFRYGIKPRGFDFALNAEKYRIVEDNATHHMVIKGIPCLVCKMDSEKYLATDAI